MEPVTHALTGLILARSGFDRLSCYTTAAMAIGAEFPDVDTAWSLLGPVEGFQHHRGITHTLLGLPFEAGLILGGLWLVDYWRRSKMSRRGGVMAGGRQTHARGTLPVHWGRLYACTLLALLSHIALDWTNNYGVRPLAPFLPRWHAGSILFIFDPLVFTLLLAALILPWLFRLINAEIGVSPNRFVSRRWAAGALLAIFSVLGLRAFEHARALDLLWHETAEVPGDRPGASTLLSPRLVEASPDPFSPFRWHGASDFGPFLQLQEVNTSRETVSPNDERMDKPPQSAALQRAMRSPLGRAYLDWSPMPFLSVSDGSGESGSAGSAANTIVFFRDPRFMGAVPLLNRDGLPPLTGTVELDTQGRVVGQTLDGRVQSR